MAVYLCRQWSGTPGARQAQAVEWATAKALQRYSMPPADAPLIATLSMLLDD
jgi:8-oxo-dGTP diphosphatase